MSWKRVPRTWFVANLRRSISFSRVRVGLIELECFRTDPSLRMRPTTLVETPKFGSQTPDRHAILYGYISHFWLELSGVYLWPSDSSSLLACNVSEDAHFGSRRHVQVPQAPRRLLATAESVGHLLEHFFSRMPLEKLSSNSTTTLRRSSIVRWRDWAIDRLGVKLLMQRRISPFLAGRQHIRSTSSRQKWQPQNNKHIPQIRVFAANLNIQSDCSESAYCLIIGGIIENGTSIKKTEEVLSYGNLRRVQGYF